MLACGPESITVWPPFYLPAKDGCLPATYPSAPHNNESVVRLYIGDGFSGIEFNRIPFNFAFTLETAQYAWMFDIEVLKKRNRISTTLSVIRGFGHIRKIGPE